MAAILPPPAGAGTRSPPLMAVSTRKWGRGSAGTEHAGARYRASRAEDRADRGERTQPDGELHGVVVIGAQKGDGRPRAAHDRGDAAEVHPILSLIHISEPTRP